MLKSVVDGSRDQEEDADEETVPQKKPRKESKRSEREVEHVFQQLKKRYGSEYSGPQLRLWARMYVANTHDDLPILLVLFNNHVKSLSQMHSQTLPPPLQKPFFHSQLLHLQPAAHQLKLSTFE